MRQLQDWLRRLPESVRPGPSLGFDLGQGKPLAAILASRRSIAEGVTTAAAVGILASSIGVDMPISFAVNRILKDASTIDEEIRGLLSRPLKHES